MAKTFNTTPLDLLDGIACMDDAGLFHSRIGVDTSSTDFSGWHM